MQNHRLGGYERARLAVLEMQLERRGIVCSRVLSACSWVPRERFAPHELSDIAYEDAPLPLDEGQVMSAPYATASAIQALELKGTERVLEIGTGSGYGTALLSRLAHAVYTIERFPRLLAAAAEKLASLDCTNVRGLAGDGSLGWPESAPFDAIIVGAGSPTIPSTLLVQLAVDGRLVIPLGVTRQEQVLVRVRRLGTTDFRVEPLETVHFTPLVGQHGWSDVSPMEQRSATLS
ncbi:MAG TPA: protein-L-isoaspartate(D-aspartate) O-methyltransferase [Polyangiales bacterium]|nr:protein-L-isoaspartate(D-aspartate) O-methyltransferase [Polyangiales bacterium]